MSRPRPKARARAATRRKSDPPQSTKTPKRKVAPAPRRRAAVERTLEVMGEGGDAAATRFREDEQDEAIERARVAIALNSEEYERIEDEGQKTNQPQLPALRRRDFEVGDVADVLAVPEEAEADERARDALIEDPEELD